MHGSIEFETFKSDFTMLHNNIRKENPFAMFFTGDFNCRSKLWWIDGGNNLEGDEFEELSSQMGLYQLINEPTNFEPNRNPTCIDLTFTDQPNIVLDSGIRPSLDNFCHHQITYCTTNYRMPPSPSYEGIFGIIIGLTMLFPISIGTII